MKRSAFINIREATGENIESYVDARELFHHIAENNWDYAEPGALFWDREPSEQHTGILLCRFRL